jgi:hypothetical protein
VSYEPGIVHVHYKTVLLPPDDDNIVPVETVEVAAAGVVPVREHPAGVETVDVYETSAVTPRVKVIKV